MIYNNKPATDKRLTLSYAIGEQPFQHQDRIDGLVSFFRIAPSIILLFSPGMLYKATSGFGLSYYGRITAANGSPC
jgi:hypothetical protein